MNTTEQKENIKQKKYDALLEQRRQIISEIDGNKASFHTALISILTLISGIILFFDEELVVFYFLAFQIVFALTCYITSLLLAMDNDRDFIRAIDKYIEEKYEVDVFFFQGELHSRIINKKSNFVYITMFSACVVTLTFAGVLIFFHEEIFYFFKEQVFFFVTILVEIIGFVVVLIERLIYRKTGKSKIKKDCYQYLMRNIDEAMVVTSNENEECQTILEE